MLAFHKIQGASSVESAIVQVGSVTVSTASGDEGDVPLPTGLQEDDIVVIISGGDSGSGMVAATGYTSILGDGGAGAHSQACYKIMGATPDTTASGLTSQSNAMSMAVAFRYVDTTTPIDGTPTFAEGSGSPPNPPSQTTITNNALRCIYGVLDDDIVTMSHSWDGAALVSYYDNVGSSGNGCSIGFSTEFAPTAGSDNPPAFSSPTTDAWDAGHFALRPAFPSASP